MAGKLSNIRVKEFRAQEIPDVNLDLELAGGVDLGLDNIQFGVSSLPPVSLGITDLPQLNLSLAVESLPTVRLESDSAVRTTSTLDSTSALKTDNKVDLALDVRVRELPRIDLQFGFRPMRIHLPLNVHISLTLFGCRIFEFSTCGEAMVVAEDYLPHETERCDGEVRP